MFALQMFDPDYFPVIPDEKVIVSDALSLNSNIEPLERKTEEYLFIHYVTTLRDGGIMRGFEHDSKHDNNVCDNSKEFDMVSQATEILNKDCCPVCHENDSDNLQVEGNCNEINIL